MEYSGVTVEKILVLLELFPKLRWNFLPFRSYSGILTYASCRLSGIYIKI
jgi:hypothetical protein